MDPRNDSGELLEYLFNVRDDASHDIEKIIINKEDNYTELHKDLKDAFSKLWAKYKNRKEYGVFWIGTMKVMLDKYDVDNSNEGFLPYLLRFLELVNDKAHYDFHTKLVDDQKN